MAELDRTPCPVEQRDQLSQLLTQEEAAGRLNVAPRFVYRCMRERRIRYVRVGRFVRIPESSLADFIEAGTVEKWSPHAHANLRGY